MAYSRIQSVFTYRTTSGGQSYDYDVVVDTQTLVSVRNIRGPRGLIQDVLTGLPTEVVTDIHEVMDLVKLLVAETSVASGTVQFTGQTSRAVVFGAAVVNNTSYRVLYTTPDGTFLRTESATTAGFTIVAPSAYGSVASPKDVLYTVLVSTGMNSVFSGELTFVPADNGVKAVAFPVAQASAAYRVLLSPSDFFPARVSSKTKSGFNIVLGTSLAANTTVKVGYDVFV